MEAPLTPPEDTPEDAAPDAAAGDVLQAAQDLADQSKDFAEKLRSAGVDDNTVEQVLKIADVFDAVAQAGDAAPEDSEEPPADEEPPNPEDEAPEEDASPDEKPESEEPEHPKKYTMDSAMNETMDEMRAKKKKK